MRAVTIVRSSEATESAAVNPPRKLAIITTVWRYLSHAQHMGDRFLVGYPLGGKWHRPALEVAALYVDQKPAGDQSAERAQNFGFKVYPTIAEALRCGGPKLAVDGVLIIGEHGDYPHNEKGQILYPRYEFFRQTIDVFEADGRAVPVFNDKHLSYSFTKASAMVEASKRLRLSLSGRVVAAGDLAAAADRAAARLRDRAGPHGGSRRFRRDGLSCLGGHAMHGRAAAGRRDRRAERAIGRGRCGLESRRRRAVVMGSARISAVAI